MKRKEGKSLVLLAAVGYDAKQEWETMALKTKAAKDGEGQGRF